MRSRSIVQPCQTSLAGITPSARIPATLKLSRCRFNDLPFTHRYDQVSLLTAWLVIDKRSAGGGAPTGTPFTLHLGWITAALLPRGHLRRSLLPPSMPRFASTQLGLTDSPRLRQLTPMSDICDWRF